MKKPAKELIVDAFYRLLGGVVRLGLRNGVSYKEFTNIAKRLYIEIAEREYGLQGRKTNIARIGLMTGLDRKEIRRLIDSYQQMDGYQLNNAPDKLSKILTAWHQDEEYIDKNGTPLDIPMDGPAPSFTQLVKVHGGGDIAAVTVLREFTYSKAVVKHDDDKISVLRPYYVPNYHQDKNTSPELVNPEAITQGSSMLVDHINTIFHNLYRQDRGLREKLDLRATNVAVRKEAVPEFYQLIDRKGLAFLQEVDEWLGQHEVDSQTEEHERLGVGVYFIEGRNNNT